MKRLIVSLGSRRARGFLLALLAVLIAIENGPAFAAEGVITKSAAPGPVLILSNSNVEPSVGYSRFNVTPFDISGEVSLMPKQLLEIRWSTTYYPQTLNDNVELCYYRPYSAERSCEPIQPNSSGVVMRFNDQPFGRGSIVDIRHRVLGGTPPYARAAGVDSVRIKYRY